MSVVPQPEPARLNEPPNRPPAPIRTDEEALRRALQTALLPALEKLSRMAEATERCARALEEYNRRSH